MAEACASSSEEQKPSALESCCYNRPVEEIREADFPSLQDQVYLDHAGTPPIPKSLVERYSADLAANLYGNPHAFSKSSQLSTRMIEDIRHKVLVWVGVDPDEYDLIFVANATAALKLVSDVFRAQPGGFWYGYHKDAHTSLVGLREEAHAGHHCFESDNEMLSAIKEAGAAVGDAFKLFAYPAQSNMTGRRLPVRWCRHIKESGDNSTGRKCFSLLDAAALMSTSAIDLSDSLTNPDMVSFSFYKMFGFPDLGGLLVRHEMAPLFARRAFFGGGTVDVAVSVKEQWHIRKSSSIHDGAEDGTPAFHSILALGYAIDLQRQLFGSQQAITKHTSHLTRRLYNGLSQLRHANGNAACEIYKHLGSIVDDSSTQGPILAFNFRRSNGEWYSTLEVEKLAMVRNIHIRSGGLCNPAGLSDALGLAPWEMQRNFSSGFRCGHENDTMHGKPTAVLRASLGAISTQGDVESFLAFCEEFFVEQMHCLPPDLSMLRGDYLEEDCLYIESLTVYPIKSCGGWQIPSDITWEVRPEGLLWDREWCLVHTGTGHALSQKRNPRMALLKPRIDLRLGRLTISYNGSTEDLQTRKLNEVSVPLSDDPTQFLTAQTEHPKPLTVCGESFQSRVYADEKITDFFTSVLEVPCHLVRMSNNGVSRPMRMNAEQAGDLQLPTLRLSNESPILTISRSSLNKLNEDIKASGGKAVQAEVFRPNIVVAENHHRTPGTENPYAEDIWCELMIRGARFRMVGPCRRCQMVNIDQRTAIKGSEPFLTLAKTRRSDGKVWFGQHTCLLSIEPQSLNQERNIKASLMVGDQVVASYK